MLIAKTRLVEVKHWLNSSDRVGGILQAEDAKAAPKLAMI